MRMVERRSERRGSGLSRVVTLGTTLFVAAALFAMVRFEKAAAPSAATVASEEKPAAAAVPAAANTKEKPLDEILIPVEGLPPSGQGADFYAEYKMERDRSRSRQMEIFQELARDKDASATVRNDAQRRLIALLALEEKEMQLENLLVAEGFADPLVFLTDEGATVCVAGPELTPEGAARVGDLTTRITRLSPQQVVIMSKNPVYMQQAR